MSYNYTGTPFEEWPDSVLWNEDCYNGRDTHMNHLGAQETTADMPSPSPMPCEFNLELPDLTFTNASSDIYQSLRFSPALSPAALTPLPVQDGMVYFGSYGEFNRALTIAEKSLPCYSDTVKDGLIVAPAQSGECQRDTSQLQDLFSERDIVASTNLGIYHTTSVPWTSLCSISMPTPPERLHQPFEGPVHDASPTAVSTSRWAPPMRSTSPIQCLERTAKLSRSSSYAGYHRAEMISPSPTSAQSYDWATMPMFSQSGRSAPASDPRPQIHVAKGRKKALDPEQRKEAASMRIVGVCANCKKRKEKCDSKTPCKSCIKHYKDDLKDHPCRTAHTASKAKANTTTAAGGPPRSHLRATRAYPRPDHSPDVDMPKAYTKVHAWVSGTVRTPEHIDPASAVPGPKDESPVGDTYPSQYRVIEGERIVSPRMIGLFDTMASPLGKFNEDIHEGSGQSSSDTHHESDDLNTQDNDDSSMFMPNDGVGPYLEAFRFFNLSFGPGKYKNLDTTDSPAVAGYGNDGTETDSCCFLPGNADSSSSCNTASSASQRVEDGVSESIDNGTKLKARGKRIPASKPLDLLCWHAANGIQCKGQTGRSVEVRRLYRYVDEMSLGVWHNMADKEAIIPCLGIPTHTDYHHRARVVS
jgi:hypothetical protein